MHAQGAQQVLHNCVLSNVPPSFWRESSQVEMKHPGPCPEALSSLFTAFTERAQVRDIAVRSLLTWIEKWDLHTNTRLRERQRSIV